MLQFVGTDSTGGYSTDINQNNLLGDPIIQVFCLPPPNITRNLVSYALLNSETYFAIDPRNGAVTLQTNALDLPEEATYFATVECTLQYERQTLRSTNQIQVIYAEANQYDPIFTHAAEIDVTIPETRDILRYPHVVTLNATDQDLGVYGDITYELQSGNDGGLFEVGSETGIVSLVARLDYEMAPSHQLTIYAVNPREGQLPARFTEVSVHIAVGPRNDEPPVFAQKVYTLSFEENTHPLNFLQLQCTDADTTSEFIGYVMQSHNVPFVISYKTGEISATTTFDYEHISSYLLTFECVDVNHPSPEAYLRDTVIVNINVIPVNEYRPELKGSSVVFADIPEDSPTGTLIASGLASTGARITLQFSDDDEGLDHGTIHYILERGGENLRIINSNLNLDGLSGNLTLVQPFDLNLCDGDNEPLLIKLTVIACDIPNLENCPILRVYIRIIPVECIPAFEHDIYLINISEGAQINNHLETIPCEVSHLEDEMTTIGIASLEPETLEFFAIDQQGSLTLQKPLDFEQKNNFTFSIHCVDSRDNEVFAVVEVNVLPENDNPPTFEEALLIINVTEPITSTPVTVGYVKARDDDIGYGSMLVYSMQRSPYFNLEGDGALVLQRLPSSVLDNAFVLKVEASDGDTTASVTVLVLLPKGEGLDRGSTASPQEESEDDTVTIGLYGAIGVLSAIVLVCIVVSACLLCVVFRRSKTRVAENGNLHVLHVHHDREPKR